MKFFVFAELEIENEKLSKLNKEQKEEFIIRVRKIHYDTTVSIFNEMNEEGAWDDLIKYILKVGKN